MAVITSMNMTYKTKKKKNLKQTEEHMVIRGNLHVLL